MNKEYILEYLSQKSDVIKFYSIQKGEAIIEQDSEADNVFYLVKGMVKAFHLNESGNEFLFGIFGNNEFFGELEFFAGINYFNFVESITNCELVKIPYTEFEKLLKASNDFSMNISKRLAERLVRISDRTIEYSYYPVEYLLSKFFYLESINTGNKTIVISKEDIANYLGTNIRSINRVIKKFINNKIISAEKNLIFINDLEELKKIFISFNR